MDWKKITKKQFNDAYNTYPPSGWIRFAFKYFSKSTEKKNLKPSRTITIILLTLFGLGMWGTIQGWPRAVVGTVTLLYGVLLAILVLFLLAAVWSNNARIGKIRRILGVSKWEWNLLVDKYGA